MSVQISDHIPSKTLPPNDKIAINYSHFGTIWDRELIVIDDSFSFNIHLQVTDDTSDPILVAECQSRPFWPQWQIAINSEFDSLIKQKTFGPVIPTPPGAHLIGYKWTFVRKRNDKGEVVQYKARLVGKGFTQMSGVHYDETYSPIMENIIFCYLISFSILHELEMRLDVATTYLYDTLDTCIHIYASPSRTYCTPTCNILVSGGDICQTFNSIFRGRLTSID